MTTEEITSLIGVLAQATAPNSITPTQVATIMEALNQKSGQSITVQSVIDSSSNPVTSAAISEALESIGSDIEAIRILAGGSKDYLFGTFGQLITTATVEEELVLDTATSRKEGTYFTSNLKDGEGPVVTALKDCLVEITGFVTIKANDSYTADRLLRWYKLDEDGERYAGSTITVHFTGTTQIFSVPIAYSCFMAAGETLHLVHYSSSGSSTISANSSIFIKATPK